MFFYFNQLDILRRQQKMVLRRRIRRRSQRRSQPKTPSHGTKDDTERLLPALELQEYPINANRNASMPTYTPPTHSLPTYSPMPKYNSPEPDVPSPDGDVLTFPDLILPRKRLSRVTSSLKLSGWVGALTHRPRLHFPGKQIVLRHGEELDHISSSSSETLFGKGKETKRHSSRDDVKSGSDTGLRSAVHWYFCSPTDTVKNCPTLEFLRLRLAPPNVWL